MKRYKVRIYSPTFENGGVIEYPNNLRLSSTSNVEVEDGETIKLPNNELYKITGKKHTEGGELIYAPESSLIFSEHLKIKPEEASAILGKKVNKKLSYADLSKRFDTTKYSKILNNPNADKYEIETAKMKLAHNNSMLDLIFNAQEANKVETSKNKFQSGGEAGDIERLYPGALDSASTKGFNLSNYSNRFKQTKFNNVFYDPNTEKYWYRTSDGRYKEHFKQGYNKEYDFVPKQPSPEEESNSTPWNVQINSVTGEFILPPRRPDNLNPQPGKTVLDIVMPDRSKPVENKPLPVTTVPKKTGVGTGSSKPTSAPTVTTVDTPYTFDKIEPLAPLPSKGIKPLERGVPDISDSKVTPVTPTKEEKSKWDFGIGSKLANTILDIGLAASDKLKVINPQYRDLRKYPLFSRFVDFDDKEAGRNMALNIQQIQNSNMPEEVKQARIADINAQYRDYTAKIDFANAQRYEQKISQDTEKLQNYINANIDQHYQDIERYNEQKARVDYLKDQFKAQKKARIVNSIKAYTNYVDEINMKNQLVSENYAVNPFTGKIKYKGATPDALKKQEQEMAQYAQNTAPVKSLPGGGYFSILGPGVGLVVDADGKQQIVNFKQ